MRVSTLERGIPGVGLLGVGTCTRTSRCCAGQPARTDETQTPAGSVSGGLKGCDVELNATRGTVDLDDVHGRLVLNTSAGKIEGERVGGKLDVTRAPAR